MFEYDLLQTVEFVYLRIATVLFFMRYIMLLYFVVYCFVCVQGCKLKFNKA